MTAPARVVVLLSPEEVGELREAWERNAPFILAESPGDREEDHPFIRLIHTVQAAWERSDRVERENAELKLRLSQ